MTYFYGVDYHQDIADYRNRVGDFITLYVYLDDVTSDMSPLHILPKSHIFGVTTQPHDLKAIDNNKILYNDRIGNSSEFDYYLRGIMHIHISLNFSQYGFNFF